MDAVVRDTNLFFGCLASERKIQSSTQLENWTYDYSVVLTSTK